MTCVTTDLNLIAILQKPGSAADVASCGLMRWAYLHLWRCCIIVDRVRWRVTTGVMRLTRNQLVRSWHDTFAGFCRLSDLWAGGSYGGITLKQNFYHVTKPLLSFLWWIFHCSFRCKTLVLNKCNEKWWKWKAGTSCSVRYNSWAIWQLSWKQPISGTLSARNSNFYHKMTKIAVYNDLLSKLSLHQYLSMAYERIKLWLCNNEMVLDKVFYPIGFHWGFKIYFRVKTNCSSTNGDTLSSKDNSFLVAP